MLYINETLTNNINFKASKFNYLLVKTSSLATLGELYVRLFFACHLLYSFHSLRTATSSQIHFIKTTPMKKCYLRVYFLGLA